MGDGTQSDALSLLKWTHVLQIKTEFGQQRDGERKGNVGEIGMCDVQKNLNRKEKEGAEGMCEKLRCVICERI